jgi:hypothetical protein
MWEPRWSQQRREVCHSHQVTTVVFHLSLLTTPRLAQNGRSPARARFRAGSGRISENAPADGGSRLIAQLMSHGAT